MQVSEKSDPDSINFVWATPEHLSYVWLLQDKLGKNSSHPKLFFEESLRYQRLLLTRSDEAPIGYLVYQVLWGNTAFLSLLNLLPAYQRRGIGTSMVKLA